MFQRDKKEEEEEGTMGMRGGEETRRSSYPNFQKRQRGKKEGDAGGFHRLGGLGGYEDGVGPLLGSSRARVAFMTTRAF